MTASHSFLEQGAAAPLPRYAMIASHPFLNQIDHVGIRADDPARLFQFFTQSLGLPTASPLTDYSGYSSGRVALGGMDLDIVGLGTVARPGSAQLNPARFQILSFLSLSRPLTRLLPEIERRGLRHSGVIPFFAPGREGHEPLKLWERIYLSDLLGENVWQRALFSLTRQAPNTAAGQARLSSRFMQTLLARASGQSMVTLTGYYQRAESRPAADRSALPQWPGGRLGIEDVREVVIGVPNLIKATGAWVQLLRPLAPGDDGLWHVGAGPAIRLRAMPRHGIATLVLKVSSLEQAQRALHALRAPTSTTYDRVTFGVPGSPDLTFELTE